MPKVSVIVPVYNVGKFLPKCLDSLVNQTLTDIEIIVVNDGSTDNSQAIIDTYASNHSEIIKAYTKKNGGLSDARNYGMKKATGEFIGFVDSDDFVDVTMFEKLYNRAAETESDVVVCAHNAVVLNRNGAVRKSTLHKIENTRIYGKSIYDSHEILAFAKSYAWNKLYRREIIKDFEFPKGQLFEDSAVVYNILSAAKKVEFVDEPLYQYVVGRAGAITNTINSKVFDIFKSCDAIIKYYKSIGKFDEMKLEIESLCLMHIHARFVLFRKKGSLPLKLKYVDRAFDFIEANFPDWQKNPYFLTRRSAKLATYPIDKFNRVRENRSALKRYYTVVYLQKLPVRLVEKTINAFKKLGEKISNRIHRMSGVPNVKKSVVNSAKELSKKELRELQLLTLEILKSVVAFCDEHNLRYYLSEGSLLGAVRHGGFIPWDDDMDIAMPREDYEKFLKLWGNDTHGNCKLFHQSTYPKYYLPFAKVIFMGECRFSSLIRAGLRSMNEVKGPGIDIFPLDETGPLSLSLFERAREIRKLRNILLTKVYYIKAPKKRRPYLLSSMLNSYKSLHSKLDAQLTADYGKGEEYYTNFASAYNITKEIFPISYFEPAREIDFEGIKVKIPYKSEEVLTRIYGNYMTPPPKAMQVCPHQYIVKKK
jgi:phosphorylcholine metabolism protein LicD/glycosyltransferase involved in cell wall biosynthesis